MHKINPDIFKEYDIRGKIGKELNASTAYNLARLFSYNIGPQLIIIAKDNRRSSKTLSEAFCQGLLDSGCNIKELKGVSSSPLLYFASDYLKAKAAVMITGSHNSLDYNGFKFLLDNKPFYGKNLKEIVNNPITNGTGAHSVINLDQEYKNHLMKNLNIDYSFKIAWDCNNSGVSKILPILKLPGENLFLNTQLNQNFTNTLPDPLINESLKLIKEKIIENNCNFGLAFDGDADRLVLIKSNGDALTSEQLIYLISKIIQNDKNKKIILDIKVSQILINALIKDGFEVIMSSSGHSIMRSKIIAENALLVGECSGHFIINDSKYIPIDDALYVALRLIEYLQKNPIVELPLAPIRREFKILKLKKTVQQIYKPEGLRKSYEDGFLLIRASNTENNILVKYEAMNSNTEKLIQQELSKYLDNTDIPK